MTSHSHRPKVCSLMLSLLIAAKASASAPPELAGHWIAAISYSDSEQVQLIVDLNPLGTRWVGEFDVPEFGIENYPVQVHTKAMSVRLHLAGPDADFEGMLSESGKLAGILHFADEQYAAEFTRSGDAAFSPTFLQLEAAADDSTRVEVLDASVSALRAQFNSDRDKLRLILLLAPT